MLKYDKYEQQYRTTTSIRVFVKRGHYALFGFYSFAEQFDLFLLRSIYITQRSNFYAVRLGSYN